MRLRLLPAILLLLAPLASRAAVLLPPQPYWVSGTSVDLTVTGLPDPIPRSIEIEIVDEAGRVLVEIATLAGSASGGTTYSFAVPEGLEGKVQVRLRGESRAPYLITLLDRAIPASARANGNAPEAEKPPPPVEFRWVDAFYTHEPIYFAAGLTDDSEARFQVSFKYHLYATGSRPAKRLADGWLAPDGLYLAYTQTSLWDIAANSAPFRDTSYNPGLLWQWRDVWVRESESGRARLALLGGFEHESNGRDGTASRSINVLTFTPSLGYVSSGEWRFLLAPKFTAYLEKGDNADIDRYRGYVELLALARMPSENPDGGAQLAVTGRLGSGSRGSIQADLTYPLQFARLPGYLMFQVFSGHGETILDYDRKEDTRLRLGFSAIR